MPVGVEHIRKFKENTSTEDLNITLMPLGVEHFLLTKRTKNLSVTEYNFDAVRR